MDRPRKYHTKWSKSERERKIPHDTTYMWNLNYNTNQHIYEIKQTHRLMVAKGDGAGEGWTGTLGLAEAHQHV